MTKPVTHLLFDIETLGKRENTVVLTLACVPFTFEERASYAQLMERGFYVKFNAQEQIKHYHRSTDKDTINWWKSQSKESREAALFPADDDASMIDGLDALAQYIKGTDYEWKHGYVWARGTYFDFPKIEHMYDQAEIKIPFNTWKIRDVRTYIDILTGVDNGKYDIQLPGEFVAHNCLHDCVRDVLSMQQIFKTLMQGEAPF